MSLKQYTTISVRICESIEDGIKEIIGEDADITYFKSFKLGLHATPERIVPTLINEIRLIENDVDVVFGYVQCHALSMNVFNGKLNVPVVIPSGGGVEIEDCCALLMGLERYHSKRKKQEHFSSHMGGLRWMSTKH